MQQTLHHPPGCDELRYCARENRVMHNVVSNVVINMESVLCDLQDIMGEITTIVEQIDNVTGKVDKQCRLPTKSQLSSKINLNKSPYWNKPHWNVDATSRVSNALIDTEKSPAKRYQPSSCSSSNNVLKVNEFNRTQEEDITPNKQLATIRPQSNQEYNSNNWQRDPQITFSSKSFRQFPREGNGITSQNSAIAIVHPTIINNQSVEPYTGDKKPLYSQKLENCGSKKSLAPSNIGRSASRTSTNTISVTSTDENLLPLATSQGNEPIINKQSEATQLEEKISICVTHEYQHLASSASKTKQKSSKPQHTGNISKDLSVVTENIKAIALNEPTGLGRKLDMKSADSKEVTEQSFMLHSDDFKHLFWNIRPAMARASTGQESDIIHSSSFLAQSSPKSSHRNVKQSSAITGSLDSLCFSEFDNCFYNPDSDLDSDSATEYRENRCTTPVIDWSYLNLVGNNNIPDIPLKCIVANSNRQLFKIPKSQQSYMFPKRTIEEVRLQSIVALPTRIEQQSLRKLSSTMLNTQTVLDNPIWSHIFCSEVSCFDTDGYCGCYEIVLDSILENVDGIESFEEASVNMDSVDELNNITASFNDEYEEDDWGINMKCEYQDEYESSSVDSRSISGHKQDKSGSFKNLDNNRLHRITGQNVRSMANKLNRLALTGANGDTAKTEYKEKTCQKLSSQKSDFNMHASPKISERITNSVFVEDIGTETPTVSYEHHNLLHQSNSSSSNVTHLRNDKQFKTMMSGFKSPSLASSDTPSFTTSGRGSTLSLSSVGIMTASQHSDGLGSSIEGGELYASQSDSHSLSSETRVNTSISVHKSRMKRLRRDFFQSFYNTSVKKENETEQSKELYPVGNRNICFEHNLSGSETNRDSISESENYAESMPCYNRNINPWTAYALVHLQADDMSDSISDIFS